MGQQTQPLLLKWHCVAGKTFYYYTGDTLFLKQISTFRANNLIKRVLKRHTHHSLAHLHDQPSFKSKFACADEPRKSFRTEVPGLQGTQCNPGKPAPYYSVRQSTDLLIGKTLSAPRVI